MLGVSMQDARQFPVRVAHQLIESSLPHRPELRQFIQDTMDPDERPLTADQTAQGFLANLNAGLYDEI